MALASYSGPRISWQLDAGVSGWPWRSQIGSRGLSVQPQRSQDSPGVSQCLGMGAQESPKDLGWLQVSYSGLWGSQGSWTLRSQCRPRALNAALGLSGQPWGLTVPGYGGSGEPQGLRVAPDVLQWPWDSHSNWTLGSQGDPRGLNAAPGLSGQPWGLTVLGFEAQESPKVLEWLQVSYSGLCGSQASWTLRSQ